MGCPLIILTPITNRLNFSKLSEYVDWKRHSDSFVLSYE